MIAIQFLEKRIDKVDLWTRCICAVDTGFNAKQKKAQCHATLSLMNTDFGIVIYAGPL